MPRDSTQVLANVQLFANPAAATAVSAPVAGWAAVGAEIEQPNDPLLFVISIPQLTISNLNATCSFSLVDITGASQQIALFVNEGITAGGNSGPVNLIVPYIPAVQGVVTPTLAGPRLFALNAITSAGTAQIVAAATSPATFLILDLARQ
jgi:hypothetical protein